MIDRTTASLFEKWGVIKQPISIEFHFDRTKQIQTQKNIM